MAKSQKKGGGGRKIGRHKRAASNAGQLSRSARNRARRVERDAKFKRACAQRALKVPRGSARAKRRAGMARRAA